LFESAGLLLIGNFGASSFAPRKMETKYKKIWGKWEMPVGKSEGKDNCQLHILFELIFH